MTSSRKKTVTKTQVAAKTARKEIVNKDVSEISSEKIASSIAKSSVDIAKQLASINETAQEEIVKLNTIREAIAFKEEELTELHGKEQVLKSIDELQLEAENARIDFTTQMEERRELWRKEQAQHQQEVAERDALLARTRQREQDEYTYAIEQKRKDADNLWNDELYQRKLVEQRRIEALQKQWSEREAIIAKREQELSEKESLIANFDQTLAEAKEKAAQDAKKSVYAETSVKTQLAEKDFNSKIALQDQKIENLEEAIAEYKSKVSSLEKQNSESRDKLQFLAQSALEASSGRTALEAVQQTVDKASQGKR